MPARCLVKIFKSNKAKLPNPSAPDLFYFKPLPTWKNSKETKPWFTKMAIWHNKHKMVVSKIISDAGFEGYYTNHSLRATTATRLFRAIIPEQLILEQTRHLSNAIFA